MVINILVIVIIVLSALLWASRQRGRGLFSAFINLLCVVAAGAIALAVWEPIVYAWLLNMMEDYAWCVGLIAPFILAQVIIRVCFDLAVPKNVDANDAANFVGGAAFGAAAGMITAGIAVLGLSHLRTGKELMGYSPLTYNAGSLVAGSGLWIPADRWTVKLYEHLSLGLFATDTPLAERHPRIDESAAMMRVALRGSGENANAVARCVIKPSDVEIKGRYSVEAAPADKQLMDSFVLDSAGKPTSGKFVYADGAAPTGECTVEGFVLNFQSGASEKSGQIVMAPGQLRLICAGPDGAAIGVHPAAIVAKPEAGAGMYRFRMDAPDIYIPSVGGGSSAVFAPEFIVPKGYTPTDLIIKNTRFDLTAADNSKSPRFASTQKRDDAIRDGSLFTKLGLNVGASTPPKGGAKPDTSAPAPGTSTSKPGSAPAASSGATVVKASGSGRVEELEITSQIPDGVILDAGSLGGLEVNKDRKITDGKHQFDKKAVSENRGLDRNLRVDNFAATPDTSVVQLLLSSNGAMSLLGRSVEAAEDILPPALLDENGQRYEALGYVYAEGNVLSIRFTPGAPLRGLSELPSRISRSKRDQTARLIFRPTKGVKIVSFNLGPKQIATFEPPVKVGQ